MLFKLTFLNRQYEQLGSTVNFRSSGVEELRSDIAALRLAGALTASVAFAYVLSPETGYRHLIDLSVPGKCKIQTSYVGLHQ